MLRTIGRAMIDLRVEQYGSASDENRQCSRGGPRTQARDHSLGGCRRIQPLALAAPQSDGNSLLAAANMRPEIKSGREPERIAANALPPVSPLFGAIAPLFGVNASPLMPAADQLASH